MIGIYEQANYQMLGQLEQLKNGLKSMYDCDVIQNVNGRIKTPESILEKMRRKHYELNYKELIQNINDIAGIRITTPFKSDIMVVRDEIRQMENVHVLDEKDYISEPKESGYSAYHMIIETAVQIDEQVIWVKVEIQIRTMAFDFWSTIEHKIKYKNKKQLSKIDSKKLVWYAKLIQLLDEKMLKIYDKQK